MVEVLTAFEASLDSDVEGFTTGASALRAYAEDLRAAILAHAPGATSISDGHHTIASIHIDLSRLANPFTTADEIGDVIADLKAGIGSILEGVETCHGAYSDAWDAGLTLVRDLSDSEGYARLHDVAVPKGQSPLDALVARTASPEGDPDNSILSATEWNNYLAQWNALSEEERIKLLAAMKDADNPDMRALIMSALATGAGVAAVLGLAEKLKGMTPEQQNEIVNLNIASLGADQGQNTASAGDSPFDQYNEKTCGSTSLIVLAAQTDPFVALWLATGETPDGHIPTYLQGMDLGAASSMNAEDPAAWVEQQVQNRSNPLPGTGIPIYPNVIGTSPGGAAREASRTGTDYDVDWTNLLFGSSDNGPALTTAAEYANQGTPVSLLVGDSSGTFPKHYVLITGYHDGQYSIYEPGSGSVYSVDSETMEHGSNSSVPGFGNWNQIYAVVNPRG